MTSSSRQFRVRDRVVLQALPPNFSNLELWIPVLADTPYQRLLEFDVVSTHLVQLLFDNEYGNACVHTRARRPFGPEITFEIVCRVERVVWDRQSAAVLSSPLKSAACFYKYLTNESGLPNSPSTVDLAKQITGDSSSYFEKVRLIYDYCLESAAQDASQRRLAIEQSETAFLTLGNREESLSLLLSLWRACGIPARQVNGYLLENLASEDEARLVHEHAWAEFFAPGAGWVPADLHCALKHKKPEVFGTLELNHVTTGHGRQIQLVPAQKGPRLAAFTAPHFEADGVPQKTFSRTLTFWETGVPAYSEF